MLTANPTELTEGKLYQMVERACPTGTRCASEKTHCELIPANPVHGGSNSTTTPTQDTTAQLEAALKAFLRATKTPRDLNKDGIYEDTNGNGSYDFADCVLLYASLSGGTPGANVLTALDVNKDKKLDKNDSLQCAAAVSGTTTTPECLLAGTCTAGENVPILNPTKIPKILSVALTPKTATQGTLIKLVTKTEGMSTSTIATALIDTAFQVTLYDDGKHDDGKAADGYYATVIDTTKLAIGTHQGAVSIGGLTSPFSFEIIQIFSRCEALKQNGSTDDKLDVLFYGAANFGTVDAFLTEARRIMNRLLAYEPYKSNASKFNFYAYRELVSGGCELVSGNQYFCGVKPIVSETLDQCPGDQHIYLTNNSQPSYAVRGQGWLFMSAPEDNGDNKVVVHEFSHALAALLDEYSLKNNPTSLPPNLNCAPLTSTTACPYPYWCGGIPASQVRLSCAPNTNQTACVQNPLCVWGSMLFSGNVTTLGGEQAQCFINWRLQPDLGMACEAGTGCFQGCVSESGAARSTRLNIMFDQHAGEFGPVNTRIIVKALQQYK
ncbi:MAG: hypothetical protein A2666_00625 [Parcubacteria group bacterium RIFCSPHIGHO2_01_FULL_47_10b]|nr:MAG: hypothetical protein A2666_00625 [Parcubacteria group bacterium RIFCSPHIGHO2_01_FULL_47_10b]